MNYRSTRDTNLSLTAAETIARGLSHEGGLFVPESVPQIDAEFLTQLRTMNYAQRSAAVMKLYLSDFTADELAEYTKAAYANFYTENAAPVHRLDGNTSFMELWHGPTCAFKDIALQILPYLLTASLRKTNESKKVCILVATSGDTGKAALEGFKDVKDTAILVFYPRDGVSDVQKLQMQSQQGINVSVCGVEGNFDDAQTGVKQIFSDPVFAEKLAEKGWFLSSANSINWGRLLPQIVYYISAYCDLLNEGAIKNGEEISFCVPTGNFGDILAGFYAKQMGLPVKRLICASNSNDVLTEFFHTGTYNRNRPFFTTVSPSMDILISSNLERLLFEMSGKDAAYITSLMDALKKNGQYTVTTEIREKLDKLFWAGCCDEAGTKANIGRVWADHHYLMDTHTSVAYSVLNQYRNEESGQEQVVVVSTASPFKFCNAVLEGLNHTGDGDGLAEIEELESFTGVPAPAPLAALRNAKVRFSECVEKEQMEDVVSKFLCC
ncbi:MAG: threonine synthase [Anaerolineaceae bacterium]|nr:threonine synthase [Anaerolineaceae bacterium]